MRNTFICFLSIILMPISILNAQAKPENYYNSSFEKIAKTEFQNLLKQDNYRFNKYDLKEQIANILYQRKTKGKLNPQEHNLVIKHLKEIEPYKNGIIIIIYYPGKDGCNQINTPSRWNIFDRDFVKKANRLTINNVLWIYKNDEDLKYYYPEKINWVKDKKNFFENLFFDMHYPCFSSTTIDREGNYISNLGEFGKYEVIDDIKTLK